MNSPIADFVNDYVRKNPVRMHMPGHKGRILSSVFNEDSWIRQIANYDITEIDGADYLSAPCGIIAESEANAGKLFGCHTYYSTEGSSLCIRAMMFLVKKFALQNGHEPFVLAGRNAHASFVNACSVLDINVDWIMQKENDSYESCQINGEELEEILKEYCSGDSSNNPDGNFKRMPDALYVTSPDYLGNMLNIEDLSKVCHRYGLMLLVDNAHGAYLKFLKESLHPIDLGADMCCDSAHKTLPVLTGGAYLQVAYSDMNPITKLVNENDNGYDLTLVRDFFAENARQALSIFATTSPSYLILQSIDLCNVFLDGNTIIREIAGKVFELKNRLTEKGYTLIGDEPMKITLYFSKKNSTLEICGRLVDYLSERNIFVEYHDDEHIVMMFSADTMVFEFEKVENALVSFSEETKLYLADRIDEKEKDGKGKVDKGLDETKLAFRGGKRKQAPLKAMTFKEAMMSTSEFVDVEKSIGRVLAQPVLNCPPCVPIYMCGEIIGEDIKEYCNGKVAVVAEK